MKISKLYDIILENAPMLLIILSVLAVCIPLSSQASNIKIIVEVGESSMNNLIQTDKELAKQLSDFGEQDNIQVMTELLLIWQPRTLQWLNYVDSRIGLPSSTREQREALTKIKEQALAEDVRLLKEYEDFMETDIMEDGYFNDKEFKYTDEEKALTKQLDELEEAYVEVFLKKNDIEKQHTLIQHRASTFVLARTYEDEDEWSEGDENYLKSYRQSALYKNWHKKYAQEAILQNANYDFNDLKELLNLENQLELLNRKRYYHHKVKEKNANESFANHWNEYSGHYRFGQLSDVATDADITAFEQKYSIRLPDNLKAFYKTIGHFSSRMNWQIGIPSLSSLNTNIESEDFGIMDALKETRVRYYAFLESQNDDGGKLTLAQYQYLNNNYKAVGEVIMGDEINTYVIYYDNAGKFGIVGHDYDSDMVFDYLELMLIESPAKYTLAQVLGAFILPASTIGMGFDQETFFELF